MGSKPLLHPGGMGNYASNLRLGCLPSRFFVSDNILHPRLESKSLFTLVRFVESVCGTVQIQPVRIELIGKPTAPTLTTDAPQNLSRRTDFFPALNVRRDRG
jgi:hypothetical protein